MGEETAKFKKGDVVQLKSGGPAMVVKGDGGEYSRGNAQQYDCQWFTERGELHEGVFPLEVLKVY